MNYDFDDVFAYDSYDEIYMNFARGLSSKSKAKRKQVGACIVTKHGVTLTGYNGTPHGWDNCCEDNYNVTKPEVIHAELNCILKAAREGISVVGAKCYVTLAPCVSCSSMLAQAGITEVIFDEDYRSREGIDLLRSNGIKVKKYLDPRLDN